MKTTFAVLVLLAAGSVLAGTLPEGWLTAVDSNAAARAANDYAGGTVRCVWAGDAPNVAAAMPANVSFQFAVTGSSQSVSNAQAVLDETCAALSPQLMASIRRCRLLGPTLQWIVRASRCNPTNEASYFKTSAHPAAFAETDFSRTNLLAFARNLSALQIPPAAVVELVSEETSDRIPLCPAVPGVDYPGVFPETTFATPFGIGLVIRAPEDRRVFRFRAGAFPASRAKVSFKWAVFNGWAAVWDWTREQRASDGYGRVIVSAEELFRRRRIDIAVFARWDEGSWSAPAIISFYASPYESRTYRNHALEQIRYVPQVRNPPPYDISAICTPADWTDSYEYDEKNLITGFSRRLPDAISGVMFSTLNEQIVETHPNGMPRIAGKVRYFIRDGQLRYEETGEEVTYKPGTFRPRRYAK